MAEASPPLILLDTHVWIWAVEGEAAALGRGAIAAIEEASQEGGLLVSAISVWEVAMLEAKGRITLSRALDDWVQTALQAPGVRLLPLSPEIAVESTRLPGEVHGDPADRILVASARIHGARLATCDRGILQYSEEGPLRVLNARN